MADPPAPPTDREIGAFVEELLRTSVMLCGLFDELYETVPPDAFGDEAPGDVLLEMFAGSMHPVAAAAGAATLREATALVGGVGDRVLDDLRAAATLAREE